ncbi:MAG: dephospho-CoA kinase [Treponema sp.]
MKTAEKSRLTLRLKALLTPMLNDTLKDGKDFPVICVTGKMASGKNFVCSVLEQMNFFTVDLDKEVHKVIEQKTNEIFDVFEKPACQKNIRIRNDDGSLDRRALGELIFSDKALLQKQESIIYPALTENIFSIIENCKRKNAFKGIILNAAVLFKTPELLSECKMILFVNSNFVKRFFRAKKRDGIKSMQILKRFSSQAFLKRKYKKTGIPVFNIHN